MSSPRAATSSSRAPTLTGSPAPPTTIRTRSMSCSPPRAWSALRARASGRSGSPRRGVRPLRRGSTTAQCGPPSDRPASPASSSGAPAPKARGVRRRPRPVRSRHRGATSPFTSSTWRSGICARFRRRSNTGARIVESRLRRGPPQCIRRLQGGFGSSLEGRLRQPGHGHGQQPARDHHQCERNPIGQSRSGGHRR